MPHALERHRMQESLVIPVLLRPVDVDATPFAHLQCLPRNGKPVTLWEHQDAALHEIAKELRLLLEKLRATPLASFQPLQLSCGSHQSFQTQSQTRNGGEMRYRIEYLEHLTERYSTVTLPIGPVEGLTLQAIFQPLTLRYDPLAAEDLQYKQQQDMLDTREAIPQREQPVIVAQTSEEALEKSPQKRLVVLGGPGTVKTTALQFLIHQQAQKALVNPTAPLPIMISLPDLARSEKILEEYLLRQASFARLSDHGATMLARAFDEGQAFLCLDSLDEVAPERRPDMIDTINRYCKPPPAAMQTQDSQRDAVLRRSGLFKLWGQYPRTSGLLPALLQRSKIGKGLMTEAIAMELLKVPITGLLAHLPKSGRIDMQ